LASQLSDALGACGAEAVRGETPPISRQSLARHQSHASEARFIRTSPDDATEKASPPAERARCASFAPRRTTFRRPRGTRSKIELRAFRRGTWNKPKKRAHSALPHTIGLLRAAALGASRRSGSGRPRAIGPKAARRAPRRSDGPGSPLSAAPRRRVSARGGRAAGGRRGGVKRRETSPGCAFDQRARIAI
jgi:hypothetical protein